MKALTASEMREVDRLTTERFGVPGVALMESAGRSVAEAFLQQYGRNSTSPPCRVVVLCGKGNNGGDGFVAARHLKEEADEVLVYLFAESEKELHGDALANYKRWRGLGGELFTIASEADWEKAWPAITSSEVILDALLGTGIRGAATGPVRQAIEDINRLSRKATAPRPAWIVAVDTPSGLPSGGEAAEGPVLQAHLTITFTAPKIGQLISPHSSSCGQLLVKQIGTPPALVEEVGKGTLRWAGPEEFESLPLIRVTDGHKGLYGHVLVVAGSLGKSGAAVMASLAALRGGAGLVTVATAAPALPLVAASHPELMSEPLPSTDSGAISMDAVRFGKFAEALKGKTVLAIGPGLGTEPETHEFIRTVVAQSQIPVVLDADGLNAFADSGDALAKRASPQLVVTPHPGEMGRLLGISTSEVQKDRVRLATDSARRWNAHVVLKGSHTVVAAPDGSVFINTTGNPGLAKGGSGDVLTGTIAAMLGQFAATDFHRAVVLGVYLHGLAADLVTQQSEASGILATEVAHALPYARRRLLEELQSRA